jgi:hypothetical protein
MEMTKQFSKAAVLTAILLAAVAAQANLLVNGDFEDQPNFGINGDGSYTRLEPGQLPGWTILANHSVTIHKNPGAYPTISGMYSANTDGEGNNGHNCDMYQDFATVAGQSYTLDYDWLGWSQSGSTLDIRISRVSDSNTVLDDQHNWDNLGVHHLSLDFIGDGSVYRLRVFGNPESGVNDNTFIVDNFDVSAVPEPATLAGLGALALRRRRR